MEDGGKGEGQRQDEDGITVWRPDENWRKTGWGWEWGWEGI